MIEVLIRLKATNPQLFTIDNFCQNFINFSGVTLLIASIHAECFHSLQSSGEFLVKLSLPGDRHLRRGPLHRFHLQHDRDQCGQVPGSLHSHHLQLHHLHHHQHHHPVRLAAGSGGGPADVHLEAGVQ